MRLPRVIVVIVVTALTLVTLSGGAGAAVPDKAAPVKLEGKVTNKGVGAVKSGAAALRADDFYFEKTFVKGKAGSKVSVTVTNEGSAPHTFTIDAQHVDETIQPGDSVSVEVKVPAKGKVANFYCRFHVSSGMQGAFFSKAIKKNASTTSKSDSSGSSGGGSSSGSRYDY